MLASDGPPDHLRQGHGGSPTLYAKAEGGPHANRARAPLGKRLTAASVVALGLVVATGAMSGQERATLYLSAMDQKGTPLLDVKVADVMVKEAAGPSEILSVSRFGWPLKVTVLVDNGPRTASALVHYRAGLKKFFDGLPPQVPVSLIATAPNPRWLIRDSRDRLQIEKGIGLMTTDEGLGRFSDALGEYASRLDTEFKDVSREQMPPYLPVLVSIATTGQDASQVTRASSLKMLTTLRNHLVWTHMIMLSPNRAANLGGLPTLDVEEGQNAEIAKGLQEVTRGSYVPVTGSGTSALGSTILPELAQAISARYIRQMTQHQISLQRPPGAKGAMKDFSLSLLHHPGAKIVVSTDGNQP
jgi:hypothetical protein